VNIYFTMSSAIFNIFLLFLSLQWLQSGVIVSCSPYSDRYHTWLQTWIYIYCQWHRISHKMSWWIRDKQFGDFHFCRWILLSWNSVLLTVVLLVTAKSKIPFTLLFFSLCRMYFPIFGA
jgi:hypothetical protein